MITTRYRVECVDRESGRAIHHVFEAATIDAAAELGTRLGYVVGAVSAEPREPIVAAHPHCRIWPWFVGGLVTGGAAAGVGVAVALGLLGQQAQHANRVQVARDSVDANLKAIGIDIEADRLWTDKWPQLTFPSRPGGTMPARVTTKYDEFDDYTTWETGFFLGTTGFQAGLFATEKGKRILPLSPPRVVTISVHKADAELAGDLVFLADGQRIVPQVRSGGGTWAHFEMATEDLLTLMRAKTVRGRVQSHEFVLSPDDQVNLQEFASVLKP